MADRTSGNDATNTAIDPASALPPQPDRIETLRLVLRRFEPEDAEAIARQLAPREMARNLGRAPHPYQLEDAEAFLARGEGPYAQAHAVTLRDGPLIGACSMTWRSPSVTEDEPPRAVLGYWIGMDYWGHGYASETVAAKLLEHFASGGGKVHARVFQDNPRSRGVLEHAGFRIVGTTLDGNAVRGGQQPMWTAECTAEDFRKGRWNLDLAATG